MPSISAMETEREAVAARLRKLESMIQRQRDLDAEFECDYLGVADISPATQVSTAQPSQQPASTTESSTKRGPYGSPAEEIVAAALQAVHETGRPLTRYELVKAVEAKGKVVGGVDKSRNMGTILWRSKAFENNGEGYRPKGWKDFDRSSDLVLR